MKEALTSFDLMALVAEWQGLVAGFIDKVYQAKDEVTLRINVSGEDRKELYCKAGKWLVLHRTEEKRESPGPFAMALRKSIDNARITAIEQRGFDRVAIVRLDKGSTFELGFEMFGKGNIVLVQGGTTVAAMRPQSFKGRKIRAGIAYDFPPAGTNPLELDREGFRKAVRSAKGQVVKVLASPLNLGGTYSEELCLRAGVAKDAPVATLTDADLDALFTALNNLAVAAEQERRPAVVFEELLKAVREERPFGEVQIKGVDKERGTVTVAVGDFDALDLDYRKDVNANANALYEARREALRKADRIVEAIRAAEDEIRVAEKKAVRAAKRPRVKPTKRFWFEAYRWCLSSEGFLILGGRDAKTNDALVRKHLKDGDRYAHADVHGAPSVVVKDGAKAGEATLREACEFALIYSKAWPAGLSGGSAFWVLPEQVSKQAESGEFLPRGGFVVRGKRNYVHDIPVQMASGEVEFEGVRKVMGGPMASVAARSTRYVVLRPGEMDRERLVARLAQVFEVPEEEVSRVLPSGGFAVHGVHRLELGIDSKG